MQQAVEVVAALIWRTEGGQRQMMICQRPPEKKRGLLWEFVGGKVEPGESGADALIRECREELGITVRPLEVFTDVTHQYPDIMVHLTLYHAEIAEGIPQLLEHCDLRWITPAEIRQYEFCPADEEILNRILFDYAKEHIPAGKWRHFKGKEYEVIGIAHHSETLAPMVIYRALYGKGELWARPAEMWLEPVERDGVRMPRFRQEPSEE